MAVATVVVDTEVTVVATEAMAVATVEVDTEVTVVATEVMVVDTVVTVVATVAMAVATVEVDTVAMVVAMAMVDTPNMDIKRCTLLYIYILCVSRVQITKKYRSCQRGIMQRRLHMQFIIHS